MRVLRSIIGFIKKLILILGSITCLIIIGYIYTTKIEPRLLITDKVVIKSNKIKGNLKGITIAQFSDTQLGPFYTQADLEKVVKKMNEIKPDIIVFTGDLIDNFSTYDEDVENVSKLLSKMEAPLGKFAVYGNHDIGGGAVRAYADIMENGGFTIVKNEIDALKLKDGSRLNIIGVDDWMLGKPALTNTLKQLDNESFNLLLMHEPDVADKVVNYPVDLQLSGHSHGGQVRVPFIGHLIAPPYGEKYTKGTYIIQGRYRLQLHVNSGLGNTKLPFRLFNIPAITVIDFD